MEPPGSAVSGVCEPDQPVRGLVHGAVAAEGDHHVVALARRLAADPHRVAALLRVDRLHGVARAERVHDEVAKPVRDRGRIRVHDHEHPPLRRTVRQQALGESLGALEGGFGDTGPNSTHAAPERGRWRLTHAGDPPNVGKKDRTMGPLTRPGHLKTVGQGVRPTDWHLWVPTR